MRKLKLQMQMTVDGYVAGPNGEMEWITLPWTDDINAYVNDLLKPVDTILLGRKLAEGFIPYWAGVATDAKNPEQDSGKMFTDTPKVVFSKTLEQSKWANTVVAGGDIVKEVNKLKQKDGGDLYACGGATFVSSLIKHNLIDEYHLFINAAAIGKGMPIFDSLDKTINLTLVRSLAFECGIVVLYYKPLK